MEKYYSYYLWLSIKFIEPFKGPNERNKEKAFDEYVESFQAQLVSVPFQCHIIFFVL
jgi:hypothetical protein